LSVPWPVIAASGKASAAALAWLEALLERAMAADPRTGMEEGGPRRGFN
jgi:hypothetical protein